MSTLAIAIPYYNGDRYLKVCLESIRAQTFKDFNIYIFDDQSPKEMPEDLKKYIESINAKVLRNEKNLGSVGNIKQIMVYNFEEEYVCIFHQDDLMHPKLMELEINQLQKNKDASFSSSSLKFISAEAGGDFMEVEKVEPQIYKNQTEAVQGFLKHAKVSLSSVVYKKSILQQAAKDFNFEQFSIIWDRPFLSFLCSFGPAYFINQPLVAYRVHPGQDSKTGPIQEENIVAFVSYYHEVLKKSGADVKRLFGFSTFALLGYYLKKGQGLLKILGKLKNPYIKLSSMGLKEWLLLARSYFRNLI